MLESFLIKLACSIIKKNSNKSVFCEYFEILKNSFLYRTPPVAAFVNTPLIFTFMSNTNKTQNHKTPYMILPVTVHCVKSVRIRSYSGPYFPALRLNTERYSVSLRIQPECEKIRTRITPNTDTFYAVLDVA